MTLSLLCNIALEKQGARPKLHDQAPAFLGGVLFGLQRAVYNRVLL